MKKNHQKHNWIVDVLLFACFLLMFFLDFTGLSLHQWLGTFTSAVAVYHLLTHWQWVKSVASRFFKHTSLKVRLYYLLDAGLLAGFVVILVSGLIISSWLNLPLGNANTWAELHVQASNFTLMAVVFKIGLHWRWIVNVARQKLFFPQPQLPAFQEKQPAYATVSISRRDFLSLMGVVSLASLMALGRTWSVEENSQANVAVAVAEQVSAQTNQVTAVQSDTAVEALTDMQPTSIVTQTLESEYDAISSTCIVDCPKGCSYPGRCHRYADRNNNNRCDNSECVS